MTEEWLPVPHWDRFYEVNEAGDIRSLERTVIRGDGKPYYVRPRIMRASIHPRTRLRSVLLARPGVRKQIHPHLVVREVFGGSPSDG